MARVLRGIEGADLLGPDPDVSGVTLQVPHADFLIVVLDLRLRVYLDAEGMSAEDQLRVASKLLRHWPDSAAAMVVADDTDLTSVVYEPFDVLTQASGRQPSATEGPGPLEDVVRSYLHVLALDWEPPPSLAAMPSLDLRSVAMEAAQHALEEIEGSQVRVPEKREALAAASLVNESALAALVSEVVAGTAETITASEIIGRLGPSR
ncbi:MAG TPA: hypothetical protein VIR30_02975 [Nocardioides sp.]